METVKQAIRREAEDLAPVLDKVSQYLFDHPETAYREFKARDHLADLLERHGFTVEKGVGGVETAFLARPRKTNPTRPCVAFLAETDALPKIGHGCGHNLIAAASLGAAIAFKNAVKDLAGGIVLVGTPAEEGGGGKVRLADAGVFKEMDAAMMVHPGQSNLPGKDMLGRIKFKLEFFGRAAHASNTPDQGINALDALVLAYTGINALRQTLRPDARIHGIITHGGEAPNIIPDHAAALFYVRAGSIAYREELFDRVVTCARSAAQALGADVKVDIDHPKLDPMRRNQPLEDAFAANMAALNLSVDADNGRRGSSDIGNLSHFLPAIHPNLAIVTEETPLHTTAFRDATRTAHGKAFVLNAASLLAMTAYDFLTSPELQKQTATAFM